MFTECSSKKQETLQYRTREEKTEDSRSLFSSRSVPKSHRKERASVLCKVTYIAARAREMERSARIVLAGCILAKVHTSRRRFSHSRERTGRFRRWTATISEEEKEETGIWYVWKIDSSCGVHVCPVDDEALFRARERARRGVNTSESAQHHCRINGKDCLFNRVTGSSASTDLNWNSIVYRARPCLRRHRRNCRLVDRDKDSTTFRRFKRCLVVRVNS